MSDGDTPIIFCRFFRQATSTGGTPMAPGGGTIIEVCGGIWGRNNVQSSSWAPNIVGAEAGTLTNSRAPLLGVNLYCMGGGWWREYGCRWGCEKWGGGEALCMGDGGIPCWPPACCCCWCWCCCCPKPLADPSLETAATPFGSWMLIRISWWSGKEKLGNRKCIFCEFALSLSSSSLLLTSPAKICSKHKIKIKTERESAAERQSGQGRPAGSTSADRDWTGFYRHLLKEKRN